VSFTGLLNQSVTLHRTTTEARDEIGGVSVGAETTVTLDGYLEPTRGRENLDDRNTGIGDWLLILPADADVDNWDRVTHQGRTFEIVSPPRPFVDGDGVVHHLEMDLQEVV
jgi:hypothetical protein